MKSKVLFQPLDLRSLLDIEVEMLSGQLEMGNWNSEWVVNWKSSSYKMVGVCSQGARWDHSKY